jgi:hypothetical protein
VTFYEAADLILLGLCVVIAIIAAVLSWRGLTK